jgi:hypothetical protein
VHSPPDTSFDFELRDRTPIQARPVQPKDKARLQEGLKHLSTQLLHPLHRTGIETYPSSTFAQQARNLILPKLLRVFDA